MIRWTSAYARNRSAYALVRVCAYALGSYAARTYERAYANKRAETKLRARTRAYAHPRDRAMETSALVRVCAYAPEVANEPQVSVSHMRRPHDVGSTTRAVRPASTQWDSRSCRAPRTAALPEVRDAAAARDASRSAETGRVRCRAVSMVPSSACGAA